MASDKDIERVLEEDARRMRELYSPFDPISGEGSVGERAPLELEDYPIRRQLLPVEMLGEPLVVGLREAGSVGAWLTREWGEDSAALRNEVVKAMTRLRSRYDFPFWAAMFVAIKRKGGGEDAYFRLNYPQRKFVARLEELRKGGEPIRLVMLKARQWGGSTASQLYMSWLQLVHEVGLNSLIIAHQGSGSDEIKDMFDRMMAGYPLWMLHEDGESYPSNEPKLVGVGKSGSISRVPQRNCKIKIGTAERPDSCRGGDYNLVHLSEVGVWKSTEGKTPEEIVGSACQGVLYRPMTMIIYESTAKGVGNFFHREYVDARDNPRSQFRAMFVPWYEIEQNSLEVEDRRAFAGRLLDGRESRASASNREEPGSYLWWLWERGATLSGINWYIKERAKMSSHGMMASECPSDDIEAFVNSGTSVFDKYQVEAFRRGCQRAVLVGEVYGDGDSGEAALQGVRFKEDSEGGLWIWTEPDPEDAEEEVDGRYLTVVDVGGRSDKADWSVVVVFDRIEMLVGGKPSVAAQWRGHIDIDLLAWKAAQIAAYYDNSLLVIESNTLETHDRERDVDGDQSHYILNQIREVYPNLYARRQSEEEIRQGLPRKWGFHTNIATKPMIISNLVKVVREGLYIERDSRCLEEMLVYEKRANGSYGAIVGSHDDMLMTRAIGLHVCYNEMEPPRIVRRGDARRAMMRRAVSAATI